MIPRAIYRLQFHKGFTLDAAAAQVDYLADLGISHVCASPLLRSRPGPRHGYNVVDPSVIDPDIGSEHALLRLSSALRRKKMGLILELAPGHMGVGGGDNEAWLDLLEWGRDSAYASWFDVDWRSSTPNLRNKILVPFLDRPYWDALAAGSLSFGFDEGRGGFVVRHYEHRFPICPAHYVSTLETLDMPALASMREVFRGLSALRPDRDALHRARFRLSTMATSEEGRAALRALAAAFDGRAEEGRARLHALLDRQNYRLAWWRTANDDLNWRRYLDASGLAGVKVERADVFDAVHDYVLKLYADGWVDGFRVAHLDLMADPRAYVQRLDLRVAGLAGRRPAEAPSVGVFGVPASITLPRGSQAGESSAEDGAKARRAEGAREAIGLVMHDATATPALTDTWVALSGDRQRIEDISIAARREALAERFGAELEAAARALHEVAQATRQGRDVTLSAIRRVVTELAVFFPAPRAYGDMDGRSADDAAKFATAFEQARPHFRAIDLPAAELVARWLGQETPRTIADFEQSGARTHAIARFQQLTASLYVTAHDETALHRYGRLISRNERGGDLSSLGLRPAAFHALMGERQERCPHGPTATSAPDALRGEDVRMRLATVSELPKEWDSLLRQLMEHMANLRARLEDGPCPDPADEILLYQGIIGAWPLNLRPEDPLGLGDFKERVTRWFLDAVRQSGRRTRLLFGNDAYEQGCARFVDVLLSAPAALPARRILYRFIERITVASVVNAYSQAVLKCTVPGIPEVQQGTEFWDFSLGETDNRRGVDFGARAASLGAALSPETLLQTWPDGRAKQAVMARLLRLRALEPALFAHGSYEPLPLEGMREASAIAFMRRHGSKVLVVVTTRLAVYLLGQDTLSPRVPSVRWGDTCFTLPDGVSGPLRDVITGREAEPTLGRFDLGDLLSNFPAAVLLKR